MFDCGLTCSFNIGKALCVSHYPVLQGDPFAQIRQANSPYGTLVVEDYQVPHSVHAHIILHCSGLSIEVDGATGMQQKVGETPLTYQLKAGFICTGAHKLRCV